MIHRARLLVLLSLFSILFYACDNQPTQAPNAAPNTGATPTAATPETVPEDEIIATVNDKPIHERDLLELAEPMLVRLGIRPGGEAWDKALEARRANLLDTLIANELILQHARNAGITIPNEPEQLDAKVSEFRKMFSGDEAFQQELMARKLSMDDLRKQLADEMRRAEFLRRKGEERDWRVQPEEVIAYFNQNPEFFENRVHLQVIAVYVPRDASAEVREEKRGRVELAKAQLEGGADFATVARQFSDDPAANDTGGDLGFLRLDEVDPVIQRVVVGIEPGTTAGPIESPLGYYIIRLVKRGQTLQDEPLFEQLKTELEERRRAVNVADWLNRAKLAAEIIVTSPYYQRYFPAMEVYR